MQFVGLFLFRYLEVRHHGVVQLASSFLLCQSNALGSGSTSGLSVVLGRCLVSHHKPA